MSDWMHALPLGWMALVVFGGTALVTAAIYWIVIHLATDERARTFKGVSPGLLPPLGIMFGLLVAFIAAQVWGDIDRANAAVNHEASSLRAVLLLSRPFPAEAQTRMRGLIERYIRDAQQNEWPAMARQRATLSMIPAGLADALAVGDRATHQRRRTGRRAAGNRRQPRQRPQCAPSANSRESVGSQFREMVRADLRGRVHADSHRDRAQRQPRDHTVRVGAVRERHRRVHLPARRARSSVHRPALCPANAAAAGPSGLTSGREGIVARLASRT